MSVRRRWPLAVLVATLVPYVVTRHTATGQAPVLVALYTVASLRSQRTAIISAALAAIASVTAVAARGDSATLALGRVVAVLLAAVAGLVIAERRRQRAREGKMRGQIAAADERVRIARELHDVVAHHLSVIVAQANLAAETIKPADPGFAPTQSIIATGREALADTRRVLGVLRTQDEPDERAPQPGLAALDELLERVRATGLEVNLTSEGDATALPTGLDLCAYRIIQEALTNTLRYAHASEARVTVKYSPHSLALRSQTTASVAVRAVQDSRARPRRDARASRAVRWHAHRRPETRLRYLVRAELPL